MAFGAVGWQPTGLVEVAGWPLGLYVGNLHVLWGWPDGHWGCRSNGGCWTATGAIGWQPTRLMGVAGGCRLATYMAYGGCRTGIGAVGLQPTGLMEVAGWPLGL